MYGNCRTRSDDERSCVTKGTGAHIEQSNGALMSGMVSQRMDPLVKLRRPGEGESDGKANRQSHPGEAMEGAAKS